MRRPRIALWIKRHRHGWREWPDRPILWCPEWLWRWAVRRTSAYRKEQNRIALAYIRAEAPKIREGFAKLAKLRKELGG